MLYSSGRCPLHPKCKAWVMVAGRAICFECWDLDKRSTEEKEKEVANATR